MSQFNGKKTVVIEYSPTEKVMAKIRPKSMKPDLTFGRESD